MLAGRQRASVLATDARETPRVVDRVMISGSGFAAADHVVAYPHHHLFRPYRLHASGTGSRREQPATRVKTGYDGLMITFTHARIPVYSLM